MLRFGKSRREPDIISTLSSEEDVDRDRDIARRNALSEQLRIQEQYEKLKQKKQQAEMVKKIYFFNI